jgi:hypothetical protein
MKRMWVIILAAFLCSTLVAIGFLYALLFQSANQTMLIPVDQLSLFADFLIGKRVRVEGNLVISLRHIPEDVPPYNCILCDTSGTRCFGVLWKECNGNFDRQNVVIVGVVRFGKNLSGFGDDAYYLVAERVELLQPPEESERTLFSDNFDGYAVGTFPSNGGWELVWDGMGAEYQIVTDEYSCSSTRSLQLWGNPNDWSAVVQKHFSSASCCIGYEVSMLISGVGYGGPGRIDYVGFFNREAYIWGKYYATVQFNHDTMKITTDDGSVVGTWTPGTWHAIKVLLDRNTNTYSVWIDGQKKGNSYKASNKETNNINAMSLQSDHPGVQDYFDDVRVFEAANVA